MNDDSKTKEESWRKLYDFVLDITIDDELTKNDIRVYAVLLRNMYAKDRTVWMSNSKIVERTKINKTRVVESIRRLIEKGIISIDEKGSGRRPTKYLLHESRKVVKAAENENDAPTAPKSHQTGLKECPECGCLVSGDICTCGYQFCS